ncbi:MAG: zf-HC2 domain-containing protein, partial [Acidimicrobiales bacterium]
GGLAPRDVAKVDQHMAGCEACRRRLEELSDLSQTLHRSLPPVPLFLAAAATGKWLAAAGAGQISTGTAGALGVAGAKTLAGAGAAKTAGAGASALAAKAGAGMGVAAATSAAGGTASLVVASVALFAASLLGVRAVDPPGGHSPSPTPRASTPELAAAVPAESEGGVLEALMDYPVAGLEVSPAAESPVVTAEQRGLATGALSPPNTDAARQAIPSVPPIARLGMWLPGPLAVVIALGDAAACVGAQLDAVALGCVPDGPAPAGDTTDVTVSSGGTVLPNTELTVPLPVDDLPTPPL